MALCRQVIDFVRTDLADDADQAGGVGHVAPMEVDEALLLHIPHPLIQVQVLDAARVETAAPPQDSMNLIALLNQEFREERAVLTGNTGDQSFFHIVLFKRKLYCENTQNILFYRHLHNNLFHRGADAAGSEAGLMGILREDQEEVAVADDGVDARAVGIPRGILRLVVRDGFDDLRKRLEANEFRALEGKLDIDIPPMGLIPFRVHKAGGVLADNGFNAQVQRMRADFHVRRDGRNIIQCQVDRRRQALIQADVLDVVVNHRMN